MKKLSENQIEQIRQATEEILDRTGFEVQHPALLAIAKKAGARIDEVSGTVRIPPPLLRELIGRTPSEYTIAGSGGAQWTVGNGEQYSLAIVTDPWIVDYDSGEPRRPCLTDVRHHTRIAQRLDHVAAISLMDYPVSDFPGPHSNLRAMEEYLLNHDKHLNVMAASRESLERWFRVGRILLRGEELKGSRLMTVGVAVRSPLTLTGLNAELLLAACEHDLPVVPTVCPMAGTTAPYSKAGTLLLGNAEIVFLAALAQMIRPGHPYLYAFGPSRTDMRTGGDMYYTLDKMPWKIAGVQLGQAYGIPTAAECGGTMSARYDLQSGAEGMLFMLAAHQSGANLLAGIGSCGNAMAMSGEMMQVQTDWLEAARFLTAGIDTDAHPAVENIQHVGPGGHYMEDDLTMELLRSDEFFDSELFDYGDLDEGQPSMIERAHQKAGEMAAGFECPHPGAVQEELRRFFRDECGG